MSVYTSIRNYIAVRRVKNLGKDIDKLIRRYAPLSTKQEVGLIRYGTNLGIHYLKIGLLKAKMVWSIFSDKPNINEVYEDLQAEKFRRPFIEGQKITLEDRLEHLKTGTYGEQLLYDMLDNLRREYIYN